MSEKFLTDKSMALEAAYWGFAMEGPPAFAEPGVQPHYAPDRGFELGHIDVHLTIDPDTRSVHGVSTLEILPLPVGIQEVLIDLDDMTVDAVEDAAGEPLDAHQTDAHLRVRGLPRDGGHIRIRWHGEPTRGLYFTGPTPAEPDRAPVVWSQCQDEDAHFFMPCVDHPSVKCPWTIRVTVPDGVQAISNGKLVGVEDGTWHYEQTDPMPAYLFTVCVGDFEIIEDTGASVPVRYLAPKGTDTDTLRRVFSKTPRMIAHFEKVYGHPYPWPRYDQVVVPDFIFGGMENVASTTLTDLVLTDERAAIDWDAESLIAHELAHQWFGDLVTCQDWSQGYLNEAWATYSEIVWRAEDLGQDEADYHLYVDLKNYLAESAGRYRRPIVSYDFREPIDMFDRHLYEKGALVVHTLRHELGDDVFWPAVKRYLHDNAHTTVHTRDFQVALEQTSGRNLDGFFQDWVHSPGHPNLRIKSAWDKTLLKVTVTQTQKGDNVPKAYRFGLHLRVETSDGVQSIVLPIRERSRTWAIPVDAEPVRIEVDADFRVLANIHVSAPRKWLIASLKNDASVVGRIRAAKALCKDGSPKAIHALGAALAAEPFWGVKAEIATLLGKTGTDAAQTALVACVTDPHPKARAAIVDALGHLPSHPDVIEALTRIARGGDESIHVEGSAIRSLGRLRAPGTIELAAEIADRPSWGALLSCRALQAMALTRDPAALPHLLRWTDEERPERARCAAATALGRLAQADESCRQDAVERLLDLVQTGGFRIKYAAVPALGGARDPQALPVLRSIHEGQSDGRIRRQAYEAVGRLSKGGSGDGAVAQLRKDLESLRSENKKLRGRVDLLEHTDPDLSE